MCYRALNLIFTDTNKSQSSITAALKATTLKPPVRCRAGPPHAVRPDLSGMDAGPLEGVLWCLAPESWQHIV